MAQSAFLTDQQVLGQEPETADIARQRKIAELLMSQATEQPQGQVISGHYVAPSWAQQIAPLAKAAIGTSLSQSLDTKQQQLAEALRGKKAEELSTFQQLVSKPETRNQAFQYAAKSQTLQPLVSELMKPRELAEGAKLVLPNIGGEAPLELATGATKESEAIRGYKLAQSQGFNGSFLDYETALKRAGATNLSVNTGQHGFDNALKLRQDLKSEPIYKGFEEIKSAKNQIDQAAQMKSPAGDLAAATKVMKILDPGSVVRESELGMAMSATGLEDRVRNYANLVVTGQKLTPAQRKDFVELSDKLFNVAGQQYNAKRQEYADIAKANGLDVAAAAGPEIKLKQPQANTNIRSLADQILQGK